MNSQIKPYYDQFMRYYNGLQAREQRMLVLGGIAVALTLVWLIIIEPFQARTESLQMAVRSGETGLVSMQEMVDEARGLMGNAGSAAGSLPAGESLLGLIDRTAKAAELGETMKRVEPDGANRVRVWFESAPFDDVVNWLGSLETEFGIHVETAAFDREATQGRVTARLVLAGGAG